MPSYHELGETVYQTVRAKPTNADPRQIKLEKRRRPQNRSSKLSIQMKVSSNWSGTKGLIPLIICADQLKTNYPDLSAFEQPEQPPMSRVYPNNISLAAQIFVAKNKNDSLKQD